jgi:hypothetical protein
MLFQGSRVETRHRTGGTIVVTRTWPVDSTVTSNLYNERYEKADEDLEEGVEENAQGMFLYFVASLQEIWICGWDNFIEQQNVRTL